MGLSGADPSMPTLRLTIEYDGTDFVGWQTQPNGRSVQEELERALRQILQEEVKTVAGGRTDAGVHARGQVVSLRTTRGIEPLRLRRSLNGVLPGTVVVREVAPVADEFHARYAAVSRRYRYTISRGATALERHRCWQVFYPLEVRPMQDCAAGIVGEHDFGSFCKADSDSPHHLCVVRAARWMEEGRLLVFEIEANRFLYGMVRALVGTMVEVGRGRMSVGGFRTVLGSRDRRAAGMSAPASGLVLEEITYPSSLEQSSAPAHP